MQKVAALSMDTSDRFKQSPDQKSCWYYTEQKLTVCGIRYWCFNDAGCVDSAHVSVKVFKTNPYVFVPTAFTPNGDGLNDDVKPIAVGVKQIKYFSIYNRWGQLVFKTTTNGQGWDGTIREHRREAMYMYGW